MQSPSRKLTVAFMSRSEAEDYEPPAGSMLISISDDIDDKAAINPEKWARVSYQAFVDGGYDEETIAQFGSDFDHVYADYFTPEKASALRAVIAEMAGANPPLIAINCQAGRSRSAAVAEYIQGHYAAEMAQDTPEANETVLRLLKMDAALITAIDNARNEATEQAHDTAPQNTKGFISKLLDFIGIEQNP